MPRPRDTGECSDVTRPECCRQSRPCRRWARPEGYAFVNFVDPSFAAACIEACRGLPFAGARPDKICFAEYSKNQGSSWVCLGGLVRARRHA